MKFKIGDIVKLKTDERIVYMITDSLDLSECGKEPNIEYEVAVILPIVKETLTYVYNEKELNCVAKVEERREYKAVVDYVKRERSKVGLFGEPDYVRYAETNKHTSATEDLTVEKPKKVKSKTTKNVNYSSLETIDECLDAINDLNLLYKTFKNKSYLKYKEAVEERLRELIGVK